MAQKHTPQNRPIWYGLAEPLNFARRRNREQHTPTTEIACRVGRRGDGQEAAASQLKPRHGAAAQLQSHLPTFVVLSLQCAKERCNSNRRPNYCHHYSRRQTTAPTILLALCTSGSLAHYANYCTASNAWTTCKKKMQRHDNLQTCS